MNIRKQIKNFLMWSNFKVTDKKVFGLFEVYQK